MLTLGIKKKYTYLSRQKILGHFFTYNYVQLIFRHDTVLGYVLGDFRTNPSGHPAPELDAMPLRQGYKIITLQVFVDAIADVGNK
jgi:hypothetical protein